MIISFKIIRGADFIMIYITCDRNTSERAGAGGMFQVIKVRTDEGVDLTDRIDQGVHYEKLEEVIIDLGLNPNEVDFEEE